MQRRFRTRRFLKWAGAVVCVLFLATIVCTGRWGLIWTPAPPASDPQLSLMLTRGCIVMYTTDLHKLPEGWHVQAHRWSLQWWVSHFRSAAGYTLTGIPVWPVGILGAGITGILFHSDRRLSRLGCCRNCGYDLQGTKHDACPECGAPRKPEGGAAGLGA